jgi:hypothetical protein
MRFLKTLTFLIPAMGRVFALSAWAHQNPVTPGFAGCGKTLQCCHPERSEGPRSEHYQDNARFFVAAAPQNDSAFEFFRSLFSPAKPLTQDQVQSRVRSGLCHAGR